MKIAWNIFIAICAITNVISVAHDWSIGAAPNWFVWAGSIMFNVGVILVCIRDILPEEAS